MLDANHFESDLKNLFDQLVFCQTVGRPQPECYVNIKRYSLLPELSRPECKVYQRQVLKKAPICLENLLERFLTTGDASLMQELTQLFLAPTQIATDCSEEDLQIFRNLCDRLRKTNHSIHSQILTNLQRHYPNVLSKLLEERKRHFVKTDSRTSYENILEILTQKVVGQNKAAEMLAATLACQDNQDGNTAFLFVGPTGVGKTEMAKAVASIKENRFVMLPMNQYQTEGSMHKLFGVPLGFIGCGDKSYFARELEKFSPIRKFVEERAQVYEFENIVILFDQLEEAHYKLKESILPLLDEGYFSIEYARKEGDSYKNIKEKYVFKRSIFIGTSNLYQQAIMESFRNGKAPQDIAADFINLNSICPISTSFSPEFLGRLGKIIPFGPIPKGNCYQALMRNKIKEQIILIKKQLSCQEIRIENEGQILSILEELLYGKGVDLRRIKHFFECDLKQVIQSKINPGIDLSQAILTIAPYNDKLIGIKPSGSFLGNLLVDLTDLFPIEL